MKKIHVSVILSTNGHSIKGHGPINIHLAFWSVDLCQFELDLCTPSKLMFQSESTSTILLLFYILTFNSQNAIGIVLISFCLKCRIPCSVSKVTSLKGYVRD